MFMNLAIVLGVVLGLAVVVGYARMQYVIEKDRVDLNRRLGSTLHARVDEVEKIVNGCG